MTECIETGVKKGVIFYGFFLRNFQRTELLGCTLHHSGWEWSTVTELVEVSKSFLRPYIYRRVDHNKSFF